MAEKLTAVPPDLAKHGVSLEVLNEAAAKGIDWQKILAAIQQYGPIVVQILLTIFGKTPTPIPIPTPQGATLKAETGKLGTPPPSSQPKPPSK